MSPSVFAIGPGTDPVEAAAIQVSNLERARLRDPLRTIIAAQFNVQVPGLLFQLAYLVLVWSFHGHAMC